VDDYGRVGDDPLDRFGVADVPLAERVRARVLARDLAVGVERVLFDMRPFF